jgi:orotidine-5'-phosphate decarboxylase
MSDNISKVIVALDNMSDLEMKDFLDRHGSNIKVVKIGMEAFYRYGRAFVEEIYQKYQIEIFLDLKLHDIPNTVSKAIKSLAGLPIKFLTIHLSGGVEMIRAAMASRDEHLPNCQLLGVSVLTSLSEDDCQSIWGKNSCDSFKQLYAMAHEAKLDGIVSSGFELEIATEIDSQLNHSPIKVCPGIRFTHSDHQDQKRVMSPADAFSKGANFLVMGRAITQDPSTLEKAELFE